MRDIDEFYSEDIDEIYNYDDQIEIEPEYYCLTAYLGEDEDEDIILKVLVFIRIEDGKICLINNPGIGFVEYNDIEGENSPMIEDSFIDIETMIDAGQQNGNIYGLLLTDHVEDIFEAVDYEETFEMDYDDEFFNNQKFEHIFESTKYIFNEDFIKNISLNIARSNRKINASLNLGIIISEEDEDDEIEEF
jgi:hypothetical protein